MLVIQTLGHSCFSISCTPAFSVIPLDSEFCDSSLVFAGSPLCRPHIQVSVFHFPGSVTTHLFMFYLPNVNDISPLLSCLLLYLVLRIYAFKIFVFLLYSFVAESTYVKFSSGFEIMFSSTLDSLSLGDSFSWDVGRCMFVQLPSVSCAQAFLFFFNF